MERLTDLEKDYYCDANLSDNCAATDSSDDGDEEQDPSDLIVQKFADYYQIKNPFAKKRRQADDRPNGGEKIRPADSSSTSSFSAFCCSSSSSSSAIKFSESTSQSKKSSPTKNGPKMKEKFLKETDFEREMNQELCTSFDKHCEKLFPDVKKPKKTVKWGAAGYSTKKPTGAPKVDTNSTTTTSSTRSHQTKSNKEMGEDGVEIDGTNSEDEFYEKEEKSLKEYGKTDEDLFYDPESDKNDQSWVDESRRKQQQQQQEQKQHENGLQKQQEQKSSAGNINGMDSISSKNLKLPKSDAVLNCPACMATLCYDCQRHDIYKTQYRAIFVVNCEIDQQEILYMPQQSSIKQESKKKQRQTSQKAAAALRLKLLPDAAAATATTTNADSTITPDFCSAISADYSGQTSSSTNNDAASSSSGKVIAAEQRPAGDLFKPVKCVKCKTEVAVYDSDEVYHFFNVLSGYT